MNVNSLFEEFCNYKIVVVGDVMVDAYLEGKVNRISPEAPVPIVNLVEKEERLGGAANVALNLLSLGASVAICSVIGTDSHGAQMLDLMKAKSIDVSGVISSAERKTTVKTRVIGNNQQLLRLDSEQTDDLSSEEEKALLHAVEQQLKNGCDALIFEDYNKGVLTEHVIKQILELAKHYKVVTTVDPKHKNFFSYKGVTLFKPNLKELSEGVGRPVSVQNKSDFESAVNELQEKIAATVLFITLSEHGVFIGDKNQKKYIPAHVRTIADVSGAGDTVISVATLCLVAGLPIKETAQLANLAGGLVCERVGVVAIDKERFRLEALKLETSC
jgi:rfaE bifunctional protein kinase chain/domain